MIIRRKAKPNTDAIEAALLDPSRNLHSPHPYRGVLIAVEGTDGSGKSTQLRLVKKWLESEGYGTVLTEWNSSPLVSQIIKKGKRKGILDNTTFSLLHATDFADRLNKVIIPALKNGQIILADRYIFTALARDVARLCTREWARNLYAFSLKPDGVFYFKVPVEVSLERITTTRAPSYYEAGMDMKISNDINKSYIKFQSIVIEEYDAMVPEFGFEVIDGTLPIPVQQKLFREKVLTLIKRRLK